MSNSMDELVRWFQEKYPEFVEEMRSSSHHYYPTEPNPYHIEGDVWTHTMMVCQAARNYTSPAIQMAALLHDLGKPECRKLNDDRRRASFYGHAGLSAWGSLEVMTERGLSPVDRALAFQLIAMHTDPFTLTSVQLSARLSGASESFLGALQALVKADTEGRFYSAGEAGSRADYYIAAPITNRTLPEDAPTATFLIGLPCTGKSTLVREAGWESVTHSRDSILMEFATEGESYNDVFSRLGREDAVDQLFDSRLTDAVRRKEHIVIDRTNLTRKGRNRIISRLRNQYHTRAIVCLETPSTIIERNEGREGKYIPPEVMTNMAKSFSVPTHEHFDQIDYLIDGHFVPGFGRSE